MPHTHNERIQHEMSGNKRKKKVKKEKMAEKKEADNICETKQIEENLYVPILMSCHRRNLYQLIINENFRVEE